MNPLCVKMVITGGRSYIHKTLKTYEANAGLKCTAEDQLQNWNLLFEFEFVLPFTVIQKVSDDEIVIQTKFEDCFSNGLRSNSWNKTTLENIEGKVRALQQKMSEQQIAHGDIKISNLVYTSEEEVKLIDVDFSGRFGAIRWVSTMLVNGYDEHDGARVRYTKFTDRPGFVSVYSALEEVMDALPE